MPETLLIPGPTPVPERVAHAMLQPMINHRGEQFTVLAREVQEGLQAVFRTQNPVIIFPSAGTGGLEAALVNVLSPGDKVLACTIGAFGDRFAKIAGIYGADVERLAAPWGQAIDPATLRERLRADRDRQIKAVLITHNETSTGVTNPLARLAEVVREHGALLLVDAVSSLAAIDLQTDAWGIDVVITGSQKALMCPPGLALMSVGPRAWAAAETAKMPRLYWDWAGFRKEMAKLQTPYTPAISLYYALREALRMIGEAGLATVLERHATLGRACREGVTALGLELLADPRYYSDTVTAIRVPQGIEPAALRKAVRQRGVIIAGGQGTLTDSIVRIGHLGHVTEADLRAGLQALREALADLRGQGGTADARTGS